jgi:DNA polymerase (family X)
MRKIDIARALAESGYATTPESAGGVMLAEEPDLGALMQLQGLGPKKARQLHAELGVESLDDLADALASGRVRQLKGFSAEMEERLLAELDELAGRRVVFGLADAEQQAAALIDYLQELPGVERVDVVGSVRRRCATVADLDVLVVSSRSAQVVRHFLAYPEIAEARPSDASRGAVTLRSGLPVDLRVVPRRCYGAALQYLTGSAEHNCALRRVGLERGVRISEYGVFRLDQGRAGARRVGGQREEDVYAAVGLEWVPPELRECQGELEAAGQQRLPQLITERDIRGDLHMHTVWSGDASTIEQLAHACQARGYEYCAITDCGHALAATSGSRHRQLRAQAEEIALLRQRLHGVQLLHGFEADIRVDGTLELGDADVGTLDVVLAAVHSHTRLSATRMTDRIIRAMEHPAVDILAHPTGRLIGRREPYEVDLDAVLRAAAELDVAVELNAQPDRLDLSDLQVRRAAELGARVVVSSGATSAASLAWVRYGIDQARRGWLEPRHVLNTMRWDELVGWLRRRMPQRLPGTRVNPAS